MDVDRMPEIVVQVYLGADKRLLLNPQYPLCGGRFIVDFLAVDLASKVAWLVEVTRAINPKAIVEKIAEFHQQAAQIREDLASQTGVGPDLQLGVWLFLREEVMGKARDRCASFAPPVRFTAIEDAVKNWKWLRPDGLTREPVA